MLKHLIPIVSRMDANVTKQRFEVVKANDKPGWYRLRDCETGRTLLGLYASRGGARSHLRRGKLTYCKICDREMPVNVTTVRHFVGCAATGHRKSIADVTARCSGCGEVHETPLASDLICNN